VKHPSPADLDLRMKELLEELEIAVEPSARQAMIAYLLATLKANERVNLTRIVDPLAALRLHLVDSLSAKPELDAAPAGSGLDLGTGGGFPGVPLAMATERHFTLLDSVTKKGAATRQILEELRVADSRIEVVSARAEQLAMARREAFSVVVARAVAPLPSLVELASPLLGLTGVLVALKGCPELSERESGAAVARLVGMREIGWREFSLPEGGEARTIATYAKDASSDVRLPRRTGLAQHSPLA